jgi:phosphoglycerate dehydrogenase-like enzyme
MAMILAGLRRLTYLDRTTRGGEWRQAEARSFQRQLTGKTVGIVGFGAIGRQLAKMLSGFEPTILFYDPHPPPPRSARGLAPEARRSTLFSPKRTSCRFTCRSFQRPPE